MASRIRRVSSLTVNGSTVTNVSDFQWQDRQEFDRSQADNAYHGKPVRMSTGGSGSFEVLAGVGNVPESGYATTNMVATYKDITISAGVETPTDRTVTFTGVTFNRGQSLPGESKGTIRVNFEYKLATIA